MTKINSSLYIKLWRNDANGNPHWVRRLVTVLAGENCQMSVARQFPDAFGWDFLATGDLNVASQEAGR